MHSLAALLLTLQAETPPPPLSPPPVSAPKCDAEDYDQFDFWVGEWDVFPSGAEKPVASSTIERLYNGCAIRENWQPFSGNSGGSLSNYDPKTGQWHQRWIGSSPGLVDFVGGFSDGKMILTGNWPTPSAPHQLVRMTYSKLDDGSVRQFGEASLDHGLTWATSFDFIYRAKKGTTP